MQEQQWENSGMMGVVTGFLATRYCLKILNPQSQHQGVEGVGLVSILPPPRKRGLQLGRSERPNRKDVAN